jgi:hypothetical protein
MSEMGRDGHYNIEAVGGTVERGLFRLFIPHPLSYLSPSHSPHAIPTHISRSRSRSKISSQPHLLFLSIPNPLSPRTHKKKKKRDRKKRPKILQKLKFKIQPIPFLPISSIDSRPG